MVHPLAGKPAPRSALVNVPRLCSTYYTLQPNPAERAQRVAFGTSGHRGSALKGSFNEAHILAVSEAVCRYRRAQGTDGPLFLGIDTHALSEPAKITALEVFAAHGVHVHIDDKDGYTPTPVVSHAILTYNRGRSSGLADGVVITPSHNPPEDGGFKYNPPHGGPADTKQTAAIEQEANRILEEGCLEVQRIGHAAALRAETTHRHDFTGRYVADLANAVDLEAIARAGLHIGVDPLGGAGIGYWAVIAERYKLNLEVVNDHVDPSFAFMSLDHDGKIRMDCSSPYAMAGLIGLKSRFDVAFGNDPDYDRHGIVTPGAGLLNPNHYLALAVDYLFEQRTAWPTQAAVGKTVVTSSLLDRVAKARGRALYEVPVGFKWFVDGLIGSKLGFGGEESAGASFLRRDGSVWTTDKDGIVMDLLAAEITARSGEDLAVRYRALTDRLGEPCYARIDAPASVELKQKLSALGPEQVKARELAGEPITAVFTKASGNNAAIGGLKVATENGWFAARPSGTEEIYKIYAESFRGPEHLAQLQAEAQALVDGLS
jgi:phosphoglucomutase